MTGQETSWLWGTGLIAFAFGLVFGIGFAMFFIQGFGRTKKLQEEVNRLEQELAEYKSNVTEHFKKTSTLVHKMTESYRDVYQHLATSSQQLCQEPIDMLQLGSADSDPGKLLAKSPDTKPDNGDQSNITTPKNKPAEDMLDENLGDVPYMPGSDQYTGLNKRPD